MKKRKIRKWLVGSWLTLLFFGICMLFWHNEWVYSLPTPVPSNYKSIHAGDRIDLSAKMNVEKGKPLFIHFFNPECPCSRFNIPHVRSLVKAYKDRVSFAIVVMNRKKKYTVEEIQNKFDLTVPVLFDETIAGACGVYSTPQAVLLDTNHALYFRGNYNKSRYCTDKNSNYAKMAIDSILNHTEKPVFSPYALTAYGCVLPDCKK